MIRQMKATLPDGENVDVTRAKDGSMVFIQQDATNIALTGAEIQYIANLVRLVEQEEEPTDD